MTVALKRQIETEAELDQVLDRHPDLLAEVRSV